jgi:hypothetical protein
MITSEHVNVLLGKKVELICYAQYTIYIHLQDGAMLTIEAGCEHTHDGRRKVYQLSSPVGESSLMSILENTIASTTIDANGDLRLVVSNGDTLRIYKQPQYESYRLKIGSEEFIQ